MRNGTYFANFFFPPNLVRFSDQPRTIGYVCLIPGSSLDLLKYVGGNGGRGGDVILECSPRVWDFSGLQHHIVDLFALFCYM